ncbi:MAG: sensor histidine kinase, partial [Treponema sp.]|nr:sensor histidine kinase [Treponema sp.]
LAEIPQNIYINADVFMLKNVIINILENSVKYKTKEHGQIKINIMQNDGYVFLRMTDNGPGVQAEMLPSLFDIFYRTDPSRSNKGSGLGLAISAKIIERMNGQIFAELPSDGGLSIVVKLPLLQGES